MAALHIVATHWRAIKATTLCQNTRNYKQPNVFVSLEDTVCVCVIEGVAGKSTADHVFDIDHTLDAIASIAT